MWSKEENSVGLFLSKGLAFEGSVQQVCCHFNLFIYYSFTPITVISTIAYQELRESEMLEDILRCLTFLSLALDHSTLRKTVISFILQWKKLSQKGGSYQGPQLLSSGSILDLRPSDLFSFGTTIDSEELLILGKNLLSLQL